MRLSSQKRKTHYREKSLIKPDKRGNIPGMDQDAWIIVVLELGVSSLPHSSLFCPPSWATGLCEDLIKQNKGESRYSTRSMVLIKSAMFNDLDRSAIGTPHVVLLSVEPDSLVNARDDPRCEGGPHRGNDEIVD
ncbi:hypothetical protein J6590_047172 [Homalodisca vitripennis]|nr:hypothetical protein J6590_047172 [Homalodisca vitripennis]